MPNLHPLVAKYEAIEWDNQETRPRRKAASNIVLILEEEWSDGDKLECLLRFAEDAVTVNAGEAALLYVEAGITLASTIGEITEEEKQELDQFHAVTKALVEGREKQA